MRIGITYDLRSEYLARGYGLEETAEFDRDDTVEALEQALEALGHQPERIGSVGALVDALAAGRRWDLVFNIAEGMHGFGREAQVPALLDAYGIPYTFSDPLVMSVCLHKAVTKQVMAAHGLATPAFRLVHTVAEAREVDLPLPLFAKPVAEGTSKGVDRESVIRSREALVAACERLLARYRQPVLVERFLPGREFTVGILGSGARARALGAMEVVALAGADLEVYSYENKELCEERVVYRLATDSAGRAASRLALECWRRIGGRDVGRIDVRLDEQGRASLIEVNPLPGLHPGHSDLPILCGLLGIPFLALIERILASASERVPRRVRGRGRRAVASVGAVPA
ncbi:MAG: D-alanine--D-alanine ligase [Ectothiorhodospiraceae bacterium]|nr:D-alanine--D-alanine ligase [Ectothiorhodospiraceae bacterium]